MDQTAAAALASWRWNPGLLFVLFVASCIYFRGWVRLHRQMPIKYGLGRLFFWFAGVVALFVAIASPIDAFAGLLLQVHMIQHLLLIVVAPPLLLLSQPVLSFLRGIPAPLLKNAFGPFLSWHALQRVGRLVTHPLVGWFAMASATVMWHVPRFYELALRSTGWHAAEHACFLTASFLFWWPVIGVWPGRRWWPRWMMIPYLILADFINSALAAYFVFSTQVLYPSYTAAPRLWGISALDDQSAAGAIMWVPGSFAFLVAAVVIAAQALNWNPGVRPSDFARAAAPAVPPVRVRRPPKRNLLLSPLFKSRYFRVGVQGFMLLLAAAVVLDGLFGPQISTLNLAGVLPWTFWRGFAVMALLAAGNLFCMACPFTLARDLGRRFLPARHRWPRRFRSKWIAVGLLILYLWASEAFSLWNSPWWTAWIIVGYFAAAFAVDGFFQGASFCKYVCPIGQFQFINSLVSPLEIAVQDKSVCNVCTTHDCIRGNATQRGCELYLFQPKKAGNFDCTFCLECVQACPVDNVGISLAVPASALFQDPQRSGVGRFSRRPDVAALALILVFGAFVNAAIMTGPVMGWIHAVMALLGIRSMLPVVTAAYVIGLLVAPVLFAFACGQASRVFANQGDSSMRLTCRFVLTLVPLGFTMWLIHFSYHLLTAWSSIFGVAARLFGFSFPESVPGALGSLPDWWIPVQILLMDAGLLLSLYTGWRTALDLATGPDKASRLMAPWAVLAFALYALGLWILFQPMQMRGMSMA